MRLSNNNVESLPTDMVRLLMQNLVNSGFESAFNFFIAWARTKRAYVILALLEGFPLCSLYKYRDKDSDADKASFDRGHYMSLVATFIVRSLYWQNGHEIVPALTHVGDMFLNTGSPQGVFGAGVSVSCPVHSGDATVNGCVLCNIGVMLNAYAGMKFQMW
ncbi:hypothetical protein AgCh_036539 [Apium graveolens]